MTRSISTLCLFVALGAFSACGTNPGAASPSTGGADSQQTKTSASASPILTVNGTVVNPHLDGCSVLVCSQDNADGGRTKCFIPLNVRENELQEGQTVTLRGRIRTDVMTTCMAGQILQVIRSD